MDKSKVIEEVVVDITVNIILFSTQINQGTGTALQLELNQN